MKRRQRRMQKSGQHLERKKTGELHKYSTIVAFETYYGEFQRGKNWREIRKYAELERQVRKTGSGHNYRSRHFCKSLTNHGVIIDIECAGSTKQLQNMIESQVFSKPIQNGLNLRSLFIFWARRVILSMSTCRHITRRTDAMWLLL